MMDEKEKKEQRQPRLHENDVQDLIGRQSPWLGRWFVVQCILVVVVLLLMAWHVECNGVRLIDVLVNPMRKQFLMF